MARQNKRGLELSFKRCGDGARGRWYTRVGGKPKYFGYGNGVTDRASYDAALAAFRAWQASAAINAQYERRGPVPTQFPGASWADVDRMNGGWQQSIREANEQAQRTERCGRGEQIISELLDEFLDDQRERNKKRHYVEAQQAQGVAIYEEKGTNISDARLASIERDAKILREVVGADDWDKTEETALQVLKKFRKSQEDLLFAQKIAPNTFDERIKLARMFVGWAESNYKLDALPRCMRSKRDPKNPCRKYGSKKVTAKAIPLPVLRKLWGVADDRERAYIAMGLNLGYYSKDISNMTGEAIDGGYVSHERGKTGVHVKYKLWDVTATLIDKTRNATNGRVYSANGQALNRYSKGCRIDNVRNVWVRLCERAEVEGFSFSNLRDTSSTHVQNFDGSLTDLFDCHSDRRMAAMYIDGKMVDTSALDKAIDHLQRLYGLTLERTAEQIQAIENRKSRKLRKKAAKVEATKRKIRAAVA